jgi:hypothetical protein
MARSGRDESLRRRAARMRLALLMAAAFLLLILVLERMSYAGAFSGTGTTPAAVAAQLTLSAPSLINLLALWQLADAAGRVARGDMFGGLIVRAFRRVGTLLAISSAVSILLMPALARSMGHAVARLIDADVSTLILGALGIALIFIGSLVERAGQAHRELEEFF